MVDHESALLKEEQQLETQQEEQKEDQNGEGVEEDGEQEEVFDLKGETGKITLWRSPCRTVYYFGLQLVVEICKLYEYIREHLLVISLISTAFLVVVLVLNVPGPQQQYVAGINKEIWWCLWWIGLGILSSVGLGTGLHTFLLYLGPHIATVTMAAWECSSVEFPEPPYPDVVICPPTGSHKIEVDLWVILTKVRLESFMWGVGTAIGELPPYFMARAARLSGEELDDPEYQDLQMIKEKGVEVSCTERLKLGVQNLVQKAGFFGILLCASVPNPLFDLAGLTCGYLLIPFTTFFPATLIGKAIIKVHLQMIAVIVIFTSDNLTVLENWIAGIPGLGPLIHEPFVEYMEQQKLTLHGSSVDDIQQAPTILSILFNLFIVFMILFFLVSIINGMAQHKFKTDNKDRLPGIFGKTEHSKLIEKDADRFTDNTTIEYNTTDFEQKHYALTNSYLLTYGRTHSNSNLY